MSCFVFVLHQERGAALADDVLDWLADRGHETRLLPEDAALVGRPDLAVPADELVVGADVVMSLGGDGTMLRAVDLAAEASRWRERLQDEARLHDETRAALARVTQERDECVETIARLTEQDRMAAADLDDAERRVAERIESGMVSINDGIFSNEVIPFGGWKESGLGREGGVEGLEEYLETKFVNFGGFV